MALSCPRVVVGIDPGVSGAVVRLQGGELTVARDFKGADDVVAAVVRMVPGADFTVVEQVHAMPGEGVCSVWTFAFATGVAVGSATAVGRLPVQRVAPQRWQKWYREGLELPKAPFKLLTQSVAARLFPQQAELFRRKKDHNTADAALIALWAAGHGLQPVTD
jgi:crossover junction endodeoxyribonuclease RuvC